MNQLLTAAHPDYAMVRRALVDEGLLARENGCYWRVGGTVTPDTADTAGTVGPADTADPGDPPRPTCRPGPAAGSA